MDFYNNLSINNPTSESTNFQSNSSDNLKQDEFMSQQIEFYIQQQFNICVPALIFEYASNNEASDQDFTGWDYEDLQEFFSHFGSIEALEIYGKVAVVLFRSFFDANTAKEFLQNSSNFKETEQNNFESRWFQDQDEFSISPQLKQKISRAKNRAIEIRLAFMGPQANFNNNSGYYANQQNQYDYNSSTNNSSLSNEYNGLYKSHSYNCENTAPQFNQNNMRESINSNNSGGSNNQGYSKSNRNSYNKFNNDSRKGSINSNNNSNTSYHNNNNNSNNIGKYTCRFEIQVENDKDFQIARRLIGAKGSNMKKIVEACNKTSQSNDQYNDAVKLRLRGRGSGYKEGPYNKESDDKLHLCVSSKYADKYAIACAAVQELIDTVFDEYKKHCEKNKRPCVAALALKREDINTNHYHNNREGGNNSSNRRSL